ncbi:hypothetical protein FN846DRAFT_989813 [Sphaerosporella brunnea]|uniref:Uncharacterized protein n=1 Tax=Sphaerosporella brunnea TaxID=1250544 RepID=A0A5J5EQU1_9PEZI|nr:hypothetical protein FN846DRAFT_989813 [Sphaerosporella brunnea]
MAPASPPNPPLPPWPEKTSLSPSPIPMPPPRSPSSPSPSPGDRFRAITTLLSILRSSHLAYKPPHVTIATSTTSNYTKRLDALCTMLSRTPREEVALCVRFQRWPSSPRPTVWIFVSSHEDERPEGVFIRGVSAEEKSPSTLTHPLTNYLLLHPRGSFTRHVGFLLGWLRAELSGRNQSSLEKTTRLQVLEAYMIFRQVDGLLELLRAGVSTFMRALEDVQRRWDAGELNDLDWYRFDRAAGFPADLKVGDRLWTRLAVLEGEKELWPTLAKSVERRLRWECELGLVSKKLSLQSWVASGWVLGWREQISGVPPGCNSGERERVWPLPSPAVMTDLPTDPLYTSTTARDFNAFLLHHLHLLMNTLTSLHNIITLPPRGAIPDQESVQHITLRKQLHLLLRLLHSLSTDKSHLLLRHLQYISMYLPHPQPPPAGGGQHFDPLHIPRPGTTTTTHDSSYSPRSTLLTWPHAAKAWLDNFYRPTETVHRFQSATNWHTLRRILPEGDIGIVRAECRRTLQPWEEVIHSLLGPPGAEIVISNLHAAASTAAPSSPLCQLLPGEWRFTGSVCPLATLIGLQSASVDEFRHLDSLIGSSHTACGVCAVLLGSSRFVVSRASTAVKPVALPREMEPQLRERVTREMEAQLRCALIETLWGFDPSFKELPEDYEWEWEGEESEESDWGEEGEDEGFFDDDMVFYD